MRPSPRRQARLKKKATNKGRDRIALTGKHMWTGKKYEVPVHPKPPLTLPPDPSRHEPDNLTPNPNPGAHAQPFPKGHSRRRGARARHQHLHARLHPPGCRQRGCTPNTSKDFTLPSVARRAQCLSSPSRGRRKMMSTSQEMSMVTTSTLRPGPDPAPAPEVSMIEQRWTSSRGLHWTPIRKT
jgi:hypothetical protein